MSITLENVTLKYLNVYTPVEFNGKDKFSVVFLYDDKEGVLCKEGIKPRDKDGLFCSNSNFPPTVSCDIISDYALLKETLEIANIRRLTMDYIMQGAVVDIELRLYEYNNPTYGSGMGLSTRQIFIKSAKTLLDKVMSSY